MKGPNFRLTYVPKQGGAIDHIATLAKKGAITELMRDILENNKIHPHEVSFEEAGQGVGKKGDVYEGFRFKKYVGKLLGERKHLLRTEAFATHFELSLLKSKTRDGLLLRTMDQHGTEDAKLITEGIYARILEKMSEAGPLQWDNITRTGTF